ncbi:universal stress protein [Chloroflexota bacterium]
MYERVLAPMDSSKVAEAVLPYVEELAGHVKSEVTLLHVCSSTEEAHRAVHESYLGIICEGVKRDIKERYPLKKGESIKIKPKTLVGKPADEIINFARENEFSLIVMATHPRSGIMHRTVGQVADSVLQKVNVPALLVTTANPHLEPGPRQLLDKIVVPLDGTKRGEAVLPYITELARKTWTQITLLRVIDPSQQVHTVGGLDHVRFTNQQIVSMETRAQEYLKEISRTLDDTKAFIKHEVRVGNNAKEILNLARETDARLIAISAHHYPRFKFLVSSSTTQQIMQTTDIPLFLVSAPG